METELKKKNAFPKCKEIFQVIQNLYLAFSKQNKLFKITRNSEEHMGAVIKTGNMQKKL